MEKKKTSSFMKHCSLLSDWVSKLQLFGSSSAKKEQTLLNPDWSLLPEELLQLISTHLEKTCCFVDAIHARSVCLLWRSTFPFPDLNQIYTLPTIAQYSTKPCTLKKFHFFLFRVQTQTPHSPSEYFLGGIVREDHMYVPPTKLTPISAPASESLLGGIGQKDHHSSPLQCLVKASFPGYNPISTKLLDCQILPLGHRYRIMSNYPEVIKRGMVYLPLNKEEEEFVLLFNCLGFLYVHTSSDTTWFLFDIISDPCKDLVTFRGKFYVISQNDEVFVIDPYNLKEATPLVNPQDRDSTKYLVLSGNDQELFLVEKTISTCRVSKLDEEAGEWIVVSDLGDRVIIIGQLGNFAFSVKEFPDGCGLSMNSILITEAYVANSTFGYEYSTNSSNVTFAYKYDDHGFWRLSREDRVLIRNKSAPVLALCVDRVPNKCFL